MGALRIILLWCFSWSILFLSLALVLCSNIRGMVHPPMCHELVAFVVLVAKSVREFFGG